MVRSRHAQLHEAFGGCDVRVVGAGILWTKRLRFEFRGHAGRPIQQDRDPPPGVRDLLAGERGMRIGQRHGEERHPEQKQQKGGMTQRRQVRSPHGRQDRRQPDVGAPRVSRPQAAREEHEQRDRKQNGEHEQRRPGLSEVEVVPSQAILPSACPGCHEDIPRDHTAAPPADRLPTRPPANSHRVVNRMRRNADSPRASAVSSAVISSWPFRV